MKLNVQTTIKNTLCLIQKHVGSRNHTLNKHITCHCIFSNAWITHPLAYSNFMDMDSTHEPKNTIHTPHKFGLQSRTLTNIHFTLTYHNYTLTPNLFISNHPWTYRKLPHPSCMIIDHTHKKHGTQPINVRVIHTNIHTKNSTHPTGSI